MTTEVSIAPIVFLDFDDVICLRADDKPGAYDLMLALHEVQSGRATVADLKPIWDVLFHPPAIENVMVLHEEFEPVYVLSTSWTKFLDFTSMETILMQCGLAFLVRSLHTDWETDKEPSSTRAQQIDDWLHAHPEVQNWVALDDTYSGDGFDESHRRVVLCEVGKGFTGVELEKARAVLQGEMRVSRILCKRGEC